MPHTVEIQSITFKTIVVNRCAICNLAHDTASVIVHRVRHGNDYVRISDLSECVYMQVGGEGRNDPSHRLQLAWMKQFYYHYWRQNASETMAPRHRFVPFAQSSVDAKSHQNPTAMQ